jgi:thiol-disulfide isomerase/thioredoxin
MLAAGAIAVLYVLFAAASKPETASGLMRFAERDMHALQVLADAPPLPTRTLRDAAGRETTLTAYRGEVLVVNLWATWCAPCVHEMPTLGVLQRRFEGRLRVLPVSVDSQGDLEEAKSELARLTGGTLPFLNDMTRGILFDVHAPGLPVTIIYGRDGRELARLPGGTDWSGPDAAALMEEVLSRES